MAPLLGSLKKEGYAIPKGWNAKSKTTPQWTEIRDGIRSELEKCEETVRRKITDPKDTSNGQSVPKVRPLGEGLAWAKVAREYRIMDDEGGKGMTTIEVEQIRQRLKGLVIAPVDKYNAEMAVV